MKTATLKANVTVFIDGLWRSVSAGTCVAVVDCRLGYVKVQLGNRIFEVIDRAWAIEIH